MSRKAGGGPKEKYTQYLSKQIGLKVTPSMYECIKDASIEKGYIEISEFVRDVLLSHLGILELFEKNPQKAHHKYRP